MKRQQFVLNDCTKHGLNKFRYIFPGITSFLFVAHTWIVYFQSQGVVISQVQTELRSTIVFGNFRYLFFPSKPGLKHCKAVRRSHLEQNNHPRRLEYTL